MWQLEVLWNGKWRVILEGSYSEITEYARMITKEQYRITEKKK